MQRICAKDHRGPKCPSVVPFEILHSEGPFEGVSFKHFRFGPTPQYGGHDCFHTERSFRGRYIPFGMHQGSSSFCQWPFTPLLPPSVYLTHMGDGSVLLSKCCAPFYAPPTPKDQSPGFSWHCVSNLRTGLFSLRDGRKHHDSHPQTL